MTVLLKVAAGHERRMIIVDQLTTLVKGTDKYDAIKKGRVKFIIYEMPPKLPLCLFRRL